MIICNTCKHYEDEFTNGCDILNQIRTIADTYRLEINIKISKCDAYNSILTKAELAELNASMEDTGSAPRFY